MFNLKKKELVHFTYFILIPFLFIHTKKTVHFALKDSKKYSKLLRAAMKPLVNGWSASE